MFFHLFCCFVEKSNIVVKLVRFSPSTLTPSEMSAFLNTPSMTAGESGSPCLTPLCIGNSVDTSLFRWILAVVYVL